jgi:hypothetical protein
MTPKARRHITDSQKTILGNTGSDQHAGSVVTYYAGSSRRPEGKHK